MKKVTMRTLKKMSLGEMLELSKKEIPVSEDVYICLAEDTQEREYRNKIVRRFGFYSNVTFLSNGAVYKKKPGAVGCLRGVTPMSGSLN